MLRFGRKQCSSCGNECLETDPRCWACGSWQFGPAPEDVTLDLPGPHEAIVPDRTLGWEDAPRPPSPWRIPAMVGGGLALASLLGFLVGRHSARPAEAVSAAEPARISTSQVLPPPPVVQPRVEMPLVEIRPLGPAQPRGGRHPAGATAGRLASLPPDPSPPPPSPATRWTPARTPPAQHAQPTPAEPAAVPEVAPPQPEPLDSKEARVALRNNAPIAVELRFEGFNGAPDGTIMMSPGSAFEVSMQPGDYRVQVGARGAEADSAKAVFIGKRRYGFVVDADRGPAATPIALRLREPAIDGER